MQATKKCRICGKKKKLSEFHKRKASVDGHHHQCKQCHGMQYRSDSVYTVIHDPWNSFTWGSQFPRKIILEMMDGDNDGSYLAVGTKFKRGNTVYEVTEDMTLRSAAAGVAR